MIGVLIEGFRILTTSLGSEGLQVATILYFEIVN